MKKGDRYIKKTNKLVFIIDKTTDGTHVIFHEEQHLNMRIMLIDDFLEKFEVEPKKELDYWERKTLIREQAQMDNQSMTDFDNNESY